MHMMEEERTPGFLEELQALDEGKKRKVLIAAVAIMMVLVVFVWMLYFNGIVVS